jgi:hypothetical protein
MSGKSRKKADIQSLIATFSAHVSENYPAPEVYRENLTSMLAAKKERMESGEFVASLERNLVFLNAALNRFRSLRGQQLGFTDRNAGGNSNPFQDNFALFMLSGHGDQSS